jgi:hypothetical protein
MTTAVERSSRRRDRFWPEFSKQFNSLADELFKNAPATGSGFSAYIQSHGFHGRRYMAMELGRLPSDRYAEFKLDRHVTHAERLGPYERQVLAEIVLAAERLVMIVGYAGSGKTSTIRHVLDHYARHRPSRLVDASKRTGPYHRIRSIRPSHIYVDFNPIWTKVELVRNDEASATKCLLEEWANALPIAVLDMFGPSEPLQLLIDCVEVALRWAISPPRSEQFPMYRPPGVTEFFKVFEGGLRDSKSLEDSYRKVLAALARMTAEDRVAFWHVILDIVKLHSYDDDVVIAVYDNADPMDAYL